MFRDLPRESILQGTTLPGAVAGLPGQQVIPASVAISQLRVTAALCEITQGKLGDRETGASFGNSTEAAFIVQ